MSSPTVSPSASRWTRRMQARDPHEPHRASTPLELLYDLCFVVAIAQAAHSLHHAWAHGAGWAAVGSFGMVFFAIWWAWMGFTWFASAFDVDDVPYRLKVLLQMLGLLVLAAGVPRAFEHRDFGFITLGYAIMRVGLIAQWLRAAQANPACRCTAQRYAGAIAIVQIGWLLLLLVPTGVWLWGWALLVWAEIMVPVWAERAGPTTWHPHHIAERYGLMTIIVIGESVLAGTVAVQTALDSGHPSADLYATILGAPVILFAMWWLYFLQPPLFGDTTGRRAFIWGYGHFFIFAAAAAVGTGIAVQVDYATHAAHLESLAANLSLAIPVATYVAGLWAATWFTRCNIRWPYAVAMVLCLGAAWLPYTPVVIALTLAGLTASSLRHPAPAH